MLSPMSPPCHGTPSRPLARAVTPAPPRKARHAATATQTLSSLRLALLLALLALCGCASATHWTEAHKKRLRAEGRNIVELRPAGGGRADAHLRCNVPAAAVETCLLRLSSSSTVQEARSGECLELAVAAMAPQTLTRAGFTPESVDTLQCTYLALVGVEHKSEGPTNAALLLSLGALLGAPRDGGAWLRRLMSYDEAPLQQARVHDKEMQLRAMVQETADATDDGADYDVSDAEQLLNAAEALELYGAMRHWGLGTPDEARVRKAALVVQGCEADIRGEREHALLPPLRALLAARRTAAGRVAAEARGRAKLEALDVQSQGSCTALAASFERCSGLPLMSSPGAARSSCLRCGAASICATRKDGRTQDALACSAWRRAWRPAKCRRCALSSITSRCAVSKTTLAWSLRLLKSPPRALRRCSRWTSRTGSSILTC